MRSNSEALSGLWSAEASRYESATCVGTLVTPPARRAASLQLPAPPAAPAPAVGVTGGDGDGDGPAPARAPRGKGETSGAKSSILRSSPAPPRPQIMAVLSPTLLMITRRPCRTISTVAVVPPCTHCAAALPPPPAPAPAARPPAPALAPAAPRGGCERSR